MIDSRVACGAFSARGGARTRTLPRPPLAAARGYSPPPLVGQNGLELFGVALIAGLFDNITSLLDGIYGDNPENADEALAFFFRARTDDATLRVTSPSYLLDHSYEAADGLMCVASRATARMHGRCWGRCQYCTSCLYIKHSIDLSPLLLVSC